MADELSEEEIALLKKHRAEKAKSSRKVTVKGKHAESGADYEFQLDGDEAERVISRHSSLFAEQDPDDGKPKPAGGGKSSSSSHPYFKGKSAE